MKRWITGLRAGAAALVSMMVSVAQPAAALPAAAPAASAAATTPSAVAPARPAPRVGAYPPAPWTAVPQIRGRLTAAQIGLVINEDDPYSVAVGAHYAKKRGLKRAQVLRLKLPQRERLDANELTSLRQRIDAAFGPGIQALALAWNQPYAVGCNSLTAALTLGFDGGLCSNGCGPSRESPYARAPSARPLQSHGMRLSMLLAAGTVEDGIALIDRSVAADGSLRLRGAPAALALLTTSADTARNVRASLYPAEGPLARANVVVEVLPQALLAERRRVLLVQAGTAQVPQLERLNLVPGALADHLTSFGGILNRQHNHTTAIDWIRAGATASHGTVSEPCNHLQKFPHPQWLLLHYLQGATAIEAYWRSVLWPQQSLFVGEPLAAPFAATAGQR